MKQWFLQDKDMVHQELWGITETLEADGTQRIEDFKTFTSLYKDRMVSGFEPGEWNYSSFLFDDTYTWNVVRSCVDTLSAKITSNVPAPKFLTNRGKEKTQEKAQDCDLLCQAVSYEQDLPSKARASFRDAAIYGTGVLKIYPTENEIKVERIHPARIFVDNNGCLNGETEDMFQVDFISQGKLKRMFPDKDFEIENSPTKNYSNESSTRRLVKVWEVWHRADGDNVGRHVIITEGATLLDEEWPYEYFPFAVFRFSDDVLGWYGCGLAEQLRNIQTEISYLVARVQDNVNMLGVTLILKHKSANIPDDHLANDLPFKLITWEGNQKPDVMTPPVINQQVIAYLQDLYQKAYELTGLSQLSATSQKPAGLNSGVALRTFYDIETQRFSTIARQWEQYFVNIAKLIVESAYQVSELSLSFADSRADKIEQLVWKHEKDDEEDIKIVIYPSSSLPQTPAGRLDRVVEMIQAGLVSPEEARQLLDFPDLDKYNRIANARPRKNV